MCAKRNKLPGFRGPLPSEDKVELDRKGKNCFGKEQTYREFLEELEGCRRGFEPYAGEFAVLCKVFERVKKIKAINRLRTSYGIKHEGEAGYVPNGVFITAALHCGFRYKAYENSPNPCFNMSEAFIKSLEKQYQAL
ncbi:MAG: hypothetical protein LBO80_02875 [Treponema sp.]|nr:hypothetical protein [Treponema sp.]